MSLKVVAAVILLLSLFADAKAPLAMARYGRAALPRYGKRMEIPSGADFSRDDILEFRSNICVYTGYEDLYRCSPVT
ncbi:hypothetical protein TTRE_0000434101 [Trichuris trichiura]|uniref:Uncharacterized protein n=1 Tax=Trichuris trichiura TaxID=36087 RepID=A0A077Z6G0_TRITR|nr:hypothetical protein TTRE_0000434101 [Trichuris trichiura]